MADGVRVLSYPFFCGSTPWNGIPKNVFFEIAFVRAGIRPSVQKPIALESVDFAASEMVGSKKRRIPFFGGFRPQITRFGFAKSDCDKKCATS